MCGGGRSGGGGGDFFFFVCLFFVGAWGCIIRHTVIIMHIQVVRTIVFIDVCLSFCLDIFLLFYLLPL